MLAALRKLFGGSEAAPKNPEEPKETMNEEPEGPLTEAQKQLVFDSWEKVKPISETAASLFYEKLFELDPEVKPMFSKSDMKEQGKKLMQMIGVAVNGLNSLDKLIPAVQDLGKRHVGYGVTAQHYDTVGTALLDTLAKGLGDDFTPDTKEAWTITYTTIADVMKEASYGKAA